MTSKRREKSLFDMFFFPSKKFFFFDSHFLLVVTWERALEVVVVVLVKEKCNSPRELGCGPLCRFVSAFRL